jgi:hypothetical protein
MKLRRVADTPKSDNVDSCKRSSFGKTYFRPEDSGSLSQFRAKSRHSAPPNFFAVPNWQRKSSRNREQKRTFNGGFGVPESGLCTLYQQRQQIDVVSY